MLLCRLSLHQPVVVGVLPDPEPNEVLTALNREGSVREANPRRPESADFFEMEAWIRGILFETCER